MSTQNTEVENPDIRLAPIFAGQLQPAGAPDSETQAATEVLILKVKQEHSDGLMQDRNMRKEYADKIYVLVKIWLIAVGVGLLLGGFGQAYDFFALDDSVLVTLVGGTTLGVIGLFATVAKYLFNEKRII